MLQTDFSTFPELNTPRLLLRKINAGDAATLFEIRSDKECMQHTSRPLMTQPEQAQKLIELMLQSEQKNDSISWAITLTETGEMLGVASFWKIMKEHYRAETGYLLKRAAHNKGYMKEVLAAISEYGFTLLGLHSIEARVNPANIPSIRVLEHCGFRREGYFREDICKEGVFQDTAVYSLLNGKK